MNNFSDNFYYGFGCSVFFTSTFQPENEKEYHQWLKYLHFADTREPLSSDYYSIINNAYFLGNDYEEDVDYDEFMLGVVAFTKLCKLYGTCDEELIEKIISFWNTYCEYTNDDDVEIKLSNEYWDRVLLFVNTPKLLRENNFAIKL